MSAEALAEMTLSYTQAVGAVAMQTFLLLVPASRSPGPLRGRGVCDAQLGAR